MKLDYAIFYIWKKISEKTSCDDADRIIAPLQYWINTGRASGTHCKTLGNLHKNSLLYIAKILMENDMKDYDCSISLIREYLNRKEK